MDSKFLFEDADLNDEVDICGGGPPVSYVA